ncbi:MAG: hypothetical protein WCX71_03450 [Candidatus Buchananbacteria bacterium]
MKELFDFNVWRHAPKEINEGGKSDTLTENLDKEQAASEIASAVDSFLVEVETMPNGSIVCLESSPIARAHETKDLFIERLRESIDGQVLEIELTEIGTAGEPEEQIQQRLEYMRSQPDTKFVITNIHDTLMLGVSDRAKFLPALDKWKKITGGNENLIAKLWAARPDELPGLATQLQKNGVSTEEQLNPSEFIVTPEERAMKQIRWMTSMQRVSQKYFPDRPFYFEGISHNMPSDFTILKLLGEDISVDSINRVLGGELRKPLERSSVKFFDDGSVMVEYRDLKKTYSAEEFNVLVKDIKEAEEKREEEWKDNYSKS